MIAAYRADDLHVRIEMQTDLIGTSACDGPDQPDELHRVELVANWRFQSPVQMDIGPVLLPVSISDGCRGYVCPCNTHVCRAERSRGYHPRILARARRHGQARPVALPTAPRCQQCS
ncbi:hypothetical protein [Frankia sp. Cas3]|uniref:hypothetical protein n=1 Tax=Frankia sp. Cas3 TaxID=3073926 RepID=UPI002AD25791|nr:hypothetical protein [Frankia sp. Cas3]